MWVRVAGNIFDDEAILGSLEYAVAMLEVPLVVVMGHQKCGAVSAALSGDETNLAIDELVRAIRPAIQSAKEQEGDLLEKLGPSQRTGGGGAIAQCRAGFQGIY